MKIVLKHRERPAVRALVILPVLLMTAAATVHGQTHATLTVDNARAVPVVVFLERGALDVRLGTVGPSQRQVLALPHLEPDASFQILIHPKDGLDLMTEETLTVPRNGNLTIEIPTNGVGFVPAPHQEAIPNPGAGTTTVTVDNPRSRPVTVYIERGAFDLRVGIVPAGRETTFVLPPSYVREEKAVDIFIEPEDGVELSSQSFELKPGAHLIVHVPLR